MNYTGHLCRALYDNARQTQRQLAAGLGISLGKCNSLVRSAQQDGYIENRGEETVVTPLGLEYLESMRVKNAFILAAGIDVRFVPFTHQTPKGLMEVEGERLIERLIRQLHEKNIRDITVVVGYLAEKFEYLTDKYGVKLRYNPMYATRGNLSSLYCVRQELGNSYLLRADYWIRDNIFHQYEPESWLCCIRPPLAAEEFCFIADAKRRLRRTQVGGAGALLPRGPSHITQDASRVLQPLLEQAHKQPSHMFNRWESLMGKWLGKLPLYANILPEGAVYEFASYEDLRDFDISNTETSSENNLRYICKAMKVGEKDISGLHWIETNALNHVFHFEAEGREYVCRMPGDENARFNTYKQEAAVYRAVRPLGLCDNSIHMDQDSGLKISEYHPYRAVYPERAFDTLRLPVERLRCLHTSGAKVRHSFTVQDRLHQYESLCRQADCIRFEDYTAVANSVQLCLQTIAECRQPRVLCQLNGVTNDLLQDGEGGFRFAHWEFSAMCHAVADIAMLGLRVDCSPEEYATLLQWYLGRDATAAEERLLLSYVAAGGLLWSLWGEHRQYCGEDFVEYAVRMYRQCKTAVTLLRAA